MDRTTFSKLLSEYDNTLRRDFDYRKPANQNKIIGATSKTLKIRKPFSRYGFSSTH